ncbi:FixH family protein [Aurantibacter sp.]|uniref:FixH family protein n=1 Tax=Aurantibacter sp. TaxID=2807103 RepID=UPI0035C7D2FF
MKINWGTGIVLGMLAFISFILYLVITMVTDQNYSHDLVTEEYYAKEMLYQNEIDAENNANNLSEQLKGERTQEGWQILFPKELEYENIKGKVFLYRPSNMKLDFELPLYISNNKIIIPKQKMLDGRWNISIEWSCNGKPYLYKKEIIY